MTDADGELRRAVDRLTTSIEQLRTELVRKDVYESNERARDAEVRGLGEDLRELKKMVDEHERARLADRKADEDRKLADRRLIVTALAAPIFIILVQIYLNSHIGGGA